MNTLGFALLYPTGLTLFSIEFLNFGSFMEVTIFIMTDKSERWQKRFVVIVLLLLFFVPVIGATSFALWNWPGFPEQLPLSLEKYKERMALLKYMISLGLSIIGATWLLANGAFRGPQLSGKSRLLLSWAWTFFGISALSAFIEIYLTYKDFYTWPLVMCGNDYTTIVQWRHAAYTFMLKGTYFVTDLSFLTGGVTLVLALLGVLHIKNTPDV